MTLSNIQPFDIVQFPLPDYSPLGHGNKHSKDNKGGDGKRGDNQSDRPTRPASTPGDTYGYYVYSTADIHVEDPPVTYGPEATQPPENACDLSAIARHACETGNVVIAIHGYSVSPKDAKNLYTKIYNYMTGGGSDKENGQAAEQTSKQALEQVPEQGAEPADESRNIRAHINRHVFVGYRWPAEKRTEAPKKKLRHAFEALPPLLLGTLLSTYAIGTIAFSLLTQSLVVFGCLAAFTLVSSGLVLWVSRSLNPLFALISAGVILLGGTVLYFVNNTHPVFLGLLAVLIVLSVFVGAVVITLILLRVVNYSRDRYRASNYGTTDLVEFIRQLNTEIYQLQAEGDPAVCQRPLNDIELSFIGHSLGCDVLTHAIRILSDVFDPAAQQQTPDSCLGQVFRLSRLVLVAPDIPIESILSGRANFLKSSLRRFQEAYVFSNEADLALRLASTSANYISFPARTRFRGYKLGNITVKHFDDKCDGKGHKPQYGILNPGRKLMEKGGLEMRSSSLEHLNLEELAQLRDGRELLAACAADADACRVPGVDIFSVARRFTFFDCTDYKDVCVDYYTGAVAEAKKGVLSEALGQPALNFLNYIRLVWSARNAGKLSGIEGHGGYFKGKLTQDLIYGLAFLGQEKFIQATAYASFEDINQVVKDKQIQVILSSPGK